MPGDNKGFGNHNGNSGEGIEKKEKNPKQGGNFTEKALKNINKSISEDKRKDLKENVVKQQPRQNKSQEKQNNHNEHQNHQKQPDEKHSPQTEKHQDKPHDKQSHENHAQHNKSHQDQDKPHEDKSNVEPVNPFEQLPTPDHDVRYKDQKKPEGKKVEEVHKIAVKDESLEGVDDQEPINPFESEPPPLPPIENKSLDDKPLDRRDDGIDVHKERFEGKKESSPEEKDSFGGQIKGEAEERVSTSSEGIVNPKFNEDAIDNDVQESSVKEVLSTDNEDSQIPGHVEIVNPDKSVVEKSNKDEFKEEFWSILEQAGVTKKIILYILIFLIIIVIGFWFFFNQGNGGFRPEEPEKTPIVDTSNAFSIVSSYIFGLEYAKPITPIEVVTIGEEGNISAINAAFIFGTISEPFKSDFIYYIDVIRRMDNMYHTDIYALLNMAVDRRAALNLHVGELKALIDEAKIANEKVINLLDNFDKKFEVVAAERDLSEEQFFNAADELLGSKAYEDLQSFIEVTKRSVEIKAYYNAYKIIAGKYALYLQFMEPRYQDIVANTEALIKGIKVFDIPSSDIDAIIDLEEK